MYLQKTTVIRDGKKIEALIMSEGMSIDYAKTTARISNSDSTPSARTNIKATGSGHLEENSLDDKAWKAYRTAHSFDVPKTDISKPYQPAPNKAIGIIHNRQADWKWQPLPEKEYAEKLHQNTNDGAISTTSTMICSLNLEHTEPKEDIREQHEWYHEDYFGIPSLMAEAKSICSDRTYAKKQREKPQSFIGEHEFLSNMYLCSVIIGDGDDALVFPSAENAFQAMKCKSRKQMEQFQYITPYEAKKLGSQVDLRSNWEQIKDKVMLKVLKAKFEDQELAIQLLRTDDMELCEKNYWGDDYWGKTAVVTEEELPSGGTIKKRKLVGENKLGKLLCKVRQEIRDSHIYDLYLGNFREQADVDMDWIKGRG